MAKKRVGKCPKAFRQRVADRLIQCENSGGLAKELGISRRLLYTWRQQLDTGSGEGLLANSPYNRKDDLVEKHIIPQANYDKIKDQVIATQK